MMIIIKIIIIIVIAIVDNDYCVIVCIICTLTKNGEEHSQYY